MQNLFGRIVMAAFIFIISQNSYADPWFTGPILAIPAQTVSPGQVSLLFSTYQANSDAIYNREWDRISQKTYNETLINPQFSVGLTDVLDFEYDPLYEINQNGGASYSHIGDTDFILGFQALSQKKNKSLPDLRITLEESIPTGLYDRFTAGNNGTEASGSGSYQTTLGFNFQYLSQLNADHYLNSHLSIDYTYAGIANINGLSTYGGTSNTVGHINPGNSISLDLAGEFTLTQYWVGVMEVNYIYQQASRFHGSVGELATTDPQPHQRQPTKHNIGRPDIGSGNLAQLSLAPSLEYNFSENYGVIAGVWFTVIGKNTPEFVTPIIQFSATF